jgi:ribokinase
VRCAVLGHVEWVEFARVPHVPAPGEIVHADDVWSEPAGGGAVVASQLAKLAGGCDFFTALGDDELGHDAERYLERLGLDIHVAWPETSSTRRAWVHVDSVGERAITVLGDKLLPDTPERIEAYDLVFFVSGTVEALRAARGARFLAATLRELPTLRAAGVAFDLLVGSAADPGERYESSLAARTVVLTEGDAGGTANGARYRAARPPGPVVDSYGAGDSFAAALAFGLARGDELAAALELAAAAGAAVLTGRGPYSSQVASGAT